MDICKFPKMKYVLSSIIAGVIFSGSIKAQNFVEVSFTKIASITGNQEHFIGSPISLIAKDDKVFVADAMDMKIKVFALNGDFVREFGGRGRGPGEFQNLTVLWSDRDHKIYVADYFSLKISIFDSKGEVLEEQPINSFKMQWPRKIEAFGEDKNMVMYSKKPDAKEVFHIWSGNFQEEMKSFLLPSGTIGGDELKEMALTFELGNSIVSGDEKLYYAPFFYEGKIYTKDLQENGSWSAHQGVETSTDSYEKLRPNALTKNEAGENINDYRVNTAGQSVAFRLYNGSKALFATKNDYIVHFIEIKTTDVLKEQGFEIYDANGNFLSYTSYKTQPIMEDRYTLFQEHPEAMDEKIGYIP
jgi:hypothetical protein